MKTYADKSTQTISEITTGTLSGPIVLSSGIYGTPRTTATSASGSLSNVPATVPAKPLEYHETVGATASTLSFSKNVLLIPTKRAHSPTSSSSSKKMKISSTSDGNEENVYKFKIQYKYVKSTYRIMLLKGASSLHKLAEAITSAFDFDMDHMFAFYNNFSQNASTATYSSFADVGMKIEPDEKSVARNYIYQVFKRGDKWLFYYDFGDSWEFLVECQDDNVKVKPGAEYPQVIKKNGDAPPQYVHYNGEDDSD